MLYNQPRTTMFRGEETPITRVAEVLGLPYSRVYARTTRRETGDDIEASPGKRKPHWNTIELDGEKMTLKEAIARSGSDAKYATVTHRIQRGLTFKDALVYKRNGRFVMDGEEMTLREAVERYGKVSFGTTRTRVYHLGWSLEKALTTPVRAKKRQSSPTLLELRNQE